MLPNLKIWLNHFEYHSQHPRRVPEGISNVLSVTERRLIAGSIGVFQLNEQSSGDALLRAAYRFAQEHATPEVARIAELLIREDEQHAALLRAFMAAHAIPTRHHRWTNGVLRRLRNMAELELALGLLLSTELIGHVYYRALEMATGCQRLRLLCRMLVADELAHVGFESDVLMAIRAGRAWPARLALDVAHRVFFGGAALVVWATHRSVLRRAGYGMFGVLKACRAKYRFYRQPPVKPYRQDARA